MSYTPVSRVGSGYVPIQAWQQFYDLLSATIVSWELLINLAQEKYAHKHD